ncbi:MAG TPA: twin-arginine translocase TatA/TatE family subunit [Pirellulales bacterium]|jgi:sec-independent protein translocase protein TatA|nr:twin-arginine translocase TatA/TatE family subunit [Pirellulales bacterium]
MFGLNPMELMIVGVVAVLLFGNKLPSVARSLGKSVTDFKKGMSGIEEEFRNGGDDSPRRVPKYRDSSEEREEATAPKFEPPAMEPRQEHHEDVA